MNAPQSYVICTLHVLFKEDFLPRRYIRILP